MKKLTIFMVMAALAIPAMQAKDKADSKRFNRSSKSIPASIMVQNESWGSKTVANKGEVMFWDFEDEAQIADWTFIDNDGDGFNWQYFNYSDGVTPHMTPYEGYGNMSSASYDNDTETPLNPDNWMISPQVELGGLLSFYAAGQDPSYAGEVFAVYVCEGTPNGVGDFVKVSDDFTATGEYEKYEISLKEYAGKTGCFAIRHYNCTDMFWLNVDDITLDPNYVVLDAPVDVKADPAATTAEISWTDPNGADATAWNLRYCLASEAADPVMYDFANGLGDWAVVDADGDGYNWEVVDGALKSVSWSSATSSLDPDNWVISPKVKLGGTLKYDTWNYYASWPEHYGVYVFVGDSYTSVSDFTEVASYDCNGTSSAPEAIELDLSNFVGDGYIAFRHYDSYDNYHFFIDNVEIIPGVEWTYKNGVTENPYNLEGLTPETDYQLQVQAVAGRAVSPWSDPVNFTTLAEGQEETKYYITGGFNGWEADNPVELTEEGYTFTAVDNGGQFDLDFKLLTAGENDWIWIGGIDEEGVHYFAVTEELMTSATEISLYDDGANFRLPAAGTYTVTLVREEGAKGLIEGAKIVVTKENDPVTVGVNDINAKAVAGVKYYNLAGVESNKPFDGVNIMVTTYTDGTKAAAKVIK